MSESTSDDTTTIADRSRRALVSVEESIRRQEQDEDLRMDVEDQETRTAKYVKKKVFRVLKFRLPKNAGPCTDLRKGLLLNLGWKVDLLDSDKARECWNNVQKTFVQQLRTKRATVIGAIKKEVKGEWSRSGEGKMTLLTKTVSTVSGRFAYTS